MRKEINLEELKKIELEILIEFASFCKSNNLRYYLAYGTLIGAVRHHGFIPWDDDIDVIMPRPDYDRFLQITQGSITSDIDILTYQNTPSYVFPFAKVVNNKTAIIEKALGEAHPIGVYIDIFPMDGLPSNSKDIKKHFNKIMIFRRCHSYSYSLVNKGKNPLRTVLRSILSIPCRAIGYRYFVEKLDKLAQKYDFDEAKQIAQIAWAVRLVTVIKDKYLDSVQINFEENVFNAPANYHECLTARYGNYMQLPTEAKRISNHKFLAYWK